MDRTTSRIRAVLCSALIVMMMWAVPPSQAAPGKVLANGLWFNYLDVGAGPPVILVHGSISDYREWSNQMGPLARRYRVIAYSRRYHWPNAPHAKDADATLERQADDLAAIIVAMGIAPAHVVGHSYGGATALLLARRHPEMVRTLVLAEPAVGGVLGELPRDDPISKESQAVRAEMKEAFASGNAEQIVRTYAARVAPGEFDNATGEAREMLLANIAAFQLNFSSSRPPFTCHDARLIAAPTLVISGDRSAMGLQRIAETLAQCMKTGNLVRIPGDPIQIDCRSPRFPGRSHWIASWVSAFSRKLPLWLNSESSGASSGTSYGRSNLVHKVCCRGPHAVGSLRYRS